MEPDKMLPPKTQPVSATDESMSVPTFFREIADELGASALDESMSVPTLPPSVSIQSPSQPAGGELFGRYRIEKKLGEGGMGVVYLAHDTKLDRLVALKIPRFSGNDKVAAARFLREARAAACLHHPNVCPIYDLGELNGTVYLALAFIRGRPLSQRVGPGRPVEPAEAIRVVRTVALAMQQAHSQGVIHRDLKPANILIDERDEPVVMDFGLARRPEMDGVQLTVQGEVMGTPAYMSPEQMGGEVERMGPACDIYSLGVVLYQLLTGTLPFEGDHLLSLIGRVALDAPVPPSVRRHGLDPRFDALCLKALAKRPEERWPSMQAFANALAGRAASPAVLGQELTLTFRVEGTNFAYRPPSILPIFTVGRQKRKPGSPPDEGNDFVLRVGGNDALSTRISRRHFEVHRTSRGFAVVDRSKIGLTRNGELLPKDTPVELADGDRLGVADVVTLRVQIGTIRSNEEVRQGVIQVPAPKEAGGGHVQIEASVGDMITTED